MKGICETDKADKPDGDVQGVEEDVELPELGILIPGGPIRSVAFHPNVV